MNQQPRITAIGELLIDWTSLKDNGKRVYEANPGGAPGNLVCAAQRMGIDTAFIGAVGQDAFGTLLIDTLAQHGVDTSGIVEVADTFTTMAFVTIDETGDRQFSFARKPGADTRLVLNDRHMELVGESAVVHFGTISLSDEPTASATRAAVRAAKDHGAIISFDPNVRLPLWADHAKLKAEIEWGLQVASFVKMSDDDLAFLSSETSESAARALMATYDVTLLALTLGAKGALLLYRGTDGRIMQLETGPGPAVQAIDTTGAGDIFTGTFLAGLLRTVQTDGALKTWLSGAPEDTLHKIVAYANRVAGQSTERRGGIASIPAPDEVCDPPLIP